MADMTISVVNPKVSICKFSGLNNSKSAVPPKKATKNPKTTMDKRKKKTKIINPPYNAIFL